MTERKEPGEYLRIQVKRKKEILKREREVEKENKISVQNPPKGSSEEMEFQNWRKGSKRNNI